MKVPNELLPYKFIYNFFGFLAGPVELIIHNNFIKAMLERDLIGRLTDPCLKTFFRLRSSL
jgi:hypothetical protein